MGAVIDLLKILGVWSIGDEGTVFGGKLGNGVLGKIVFIAPYRPAKFVPPVPHGHEPEGHYPQCVGEELTTPSYTDQETIYRNSRLAY